MLYKKKGAFAWLMLPWKITFSSVNCIWLILLGSATQLVLKTKWVCAGESKERVEPLNLPDYPLTCDELSSGARLMLSGLFS